MVDEADLAVVWPTDTATVFDMLQAGVEGVVKLCCQPDDPPFSILGLPRVVSAIEDYEAILQAVDIPQNGVTLCTGSIGVLPDVGFVTFIKKWGDKIQFAHLRNTERTANAANGMVSFIEAEHLKGNTDIVSVVDNLLGEEARRKAAHQADWEISMRPDHAQELLGDIGRNSQTGYAFTGSLRALAELRGVMAALDGNEFQSDWH